MTGDQLKTLRECLGLTQNEFAKMAWPGRFTGRDPYRARKRKMRRLESGARQISKSDMAGIISVVDSVRGR